MAKKQVPVVVPVDPAHYAVQKIIDTKLDKSLGYNKEVVEKLGVGAQGEFHGLEKVYKQKDADVFDAYEDYVDSGTLRGGAFSMEELGKIRAENQSNWEQAGHAIGRVAVNIVPQILGGIASMIDIPGYFSAEEAATNEVVNWAQDLKKEVDNDWFPIYEENPGQSLSLSDPAWWMARGSGLVESIGAFAVQGMVGGKIASTVLGGIGKLTRGKDLARAVLGANKSQRLLGGAEALTNATMMNQAEATISATQVFNDTYKARLAQGWDVPKAKQAASEAAATTMNINKINILLNLSSAAAFLKPIQGGSRNLIKLTSGLGKIAELAKEGGQEGLEELINLVAEKAGTAKGKGEQYTMKNALEDMGSMEGFEAAFLGALGGIGQKGIVNATEYSKYGAGSSRDENGNRISKVEYERGQYAKQQEVINELKEKGVNVTDVMKNFKDNLLFQEKLTKAEEKGDQAEVDKLREELFESQAIKAFQSGTTEVLENLYKAEAERNPEEVGQDHIDRANDALVQLKQLESIYNNFERYENVDEIFFNRANKSRADRNLKYVEGLKKESDFQLSKDLHSIAKKYSYERERPILIKENGEVVRTEIATDTVPLSYSTSNLEENQGNTEAEQKIYDKFLAEVKALPSYQNSINYTEEADKLQTLVTTTDQEFATITSKKYQTTFAEKKVKEAEKKAAFEAISRSTSMAEVEKLRDAFDDPMLKKAAESKLADLKKANDIAAKQKQTAFVVQAFNDKIKNATEDQLEQLRTEIEEAELSQNNKTDLNLALDKKIRALNGEETEEDLEEDAEEDNPLANVDSRTPEEIAAEVEKENASFDTTLPKDLPNPNTEKEDVETEVAEAASTLFETDNTTVIGEDADGNLTYSYNRSSEGYNRAAYLSREFNQKEVEGVVDREDIDNNLDNLQLLDPDYLNSGAELNLQVDFEYEGEKYDPTSDTRETISWPMRQMELQKQADTQGIPLTSLPEYIAEVPIKVADKDGNTVFYVHDNSWYKAENLDATPEEIAEDKARNYKIRETIVKKGEPVKSKVQYKSFGRLFKTFDGKSLPVSEAMPDSNLILAVGRDGAFELPGNANKLLKGGSILESQVSEGRLYAIVKVGPKNYMPIPLERKPISKEVIDTIMFAIEAHLTGDAENAIVKAIAESSLGLDITTTSGLTQYLNQFIYLFPTQGPAGLENYLLRGGSQNTLKSNMPLISVTATGIEFGRPGVNMGSYVDKNGNKVTKCAITVSANFKSKGGQATNAAGLEKLRALLEDPRYTPLANASRKDLAKNADSVLILDEEGNTNTVKYSDLVKGSHQTNVLSVNIGTEEEPKWAYTIQPTILFDTAFAGITDTKKKVTATTSTKKLTPPTPAPIGAKPSVQQNKVVEVEQVKSLVLNGENYNYYPLAVGEFSGASVLISSTDSILITDDFGNVSEVAVTNDPITENDIAAGAIFYMTAEKGVPRIVSIEESLPIGGSPNSPRTYSMKISSYAAGGAQEIDSGLGSLGKIKSQEASIGKNDISKKELAAELNKLNVKKLKVKTGIIVPIIPSVTNQGNFNEDTTSKLPTELTIDTVAPFTANTVFEKEFRSIATAIVASKLQFTKPGRFITKEGTLTKEGNEVLNKLTKTAFPKNLGDLDALISKELDQEIWEVEKENSINSIVLDSITQNKKLAEVLLSTGKIKFDTTAPFPQVSNFYTEYTNALIATRETIRVKNREDLEKVFNGIPTLEELGGKNAIPAASAQTTSIENQKADIEKLRAQEQIDLAAAIPNIAEFPDTYGEEQGNMPDDLYAIYKPIYDKYNKLITALSPAKPTAEQDVEELTGEALIEAYAQDIVKGIEDKTQLEQYLENLKEGLVPESEAIDMGFSSLAEATTSFERALEIFNENESATKTITLPNGLKVTVNKNTKDVNPLGEDSIDELMVTLEEDQLKEQRDEIDQMLIRGLDTQTQSSLIAYLSSDIIQQTLNAKEVGGLKSVKVKPILDKHLESLKELSKFYKEQGLDNKAARLDAVINQFDKVRKLVNQNMSLLSTGTVKEDIELDANENAGGLVRNNYTDDWAFTVNPKSTTSEDLKKFFSVIQAQDENGPMVNLLGLPEILPYDTVYNTLKGLLANKPADYELMIKVLELNTEKFPWINSVIDLLEKSNTPDKIKNEFVSGMVGHNIHMQFVMWSKDRNGNYSLQKWSSNSSAVEERLRAMWNSNLKGVGTRSNLVTINEDDEYIFDKTVGKALVAQAAEFAKNPAAVTNDELANWLGLFGIVISDKTYEDLRKGKFNNKGRKSWNALFTGGKGLVKALARTLDATIEGEVSFDDAKILTDSVVKALAKLEAGNNLSVYSNSFQAGGKTVYSYGNNNFLVNRMRDLTAYNQETGTFVNQDLIDKLQSISFSKNSGWLQDLTEDGALGDTMRNTFRINYLSLEALKKAFTKTQDNRKLNNLTAAEHEVIKIAFFQNVSGDTLNGEDRRAVDFFYPTMSDKTTMLTISALTRQLVLDEGEISDKNLETLYETVVVPEINRIRDKQADNIKGYEPNYFYFFHSLNSLMVPMGIDAAGNVNEKSFLDIVKDKDDTLYSPEVKQAVMEEIKSIFDGLLEKKLEDWGKLGIGLKLTDKNNRVTDNYTFLDKEYMSKVVKVGKGVDKVRYAAMDYLFNNLIANAEAYKLFAGDPALYAKFNSEKTLEENLQETFINIGKRLAGDIAPGMELADSANNNYYQVFMQDKKIDSNNVKDSAQKEFFSKIMSKFGNNYSKIEGSDAQEYTTWKEHLYVMQQLGRLTKAQYDKIYEKLEAQSRGEMKISNRLTYTELGIIMQPLKPVYVGNTSSVEDNADRRVYIKSSSFPLIPELTRGMQIDKIRQGLEAFEEEVSGTTKDGKPAFVRASFGTANKVGAVKNAVEVFDNDGNVVDNFKVNLDNTLLLSRSNFRIQQDVPYKREKDVVNIGTQERKLLFVNTLDLEIEPGVTGEDLMELYNQNYQDLYEYAYEELSKKLGLVKEITSTKDLTSLLALPASDIFERTSQLEEQLKSVSPIKKAELQQDFAEEMGDDNLERVNFINKNFDNIVEALASSDMAIFKDENNEFKKC